MPYTLCSFAKSLLINGRSPHSKQSSQVVTFNNFWATPTQIWIFVMPGVLRICLFVLMCSKMFLLRRYIGFQVSVVLTRCVLMTPFGDSNLRQHWLRQWIVALVQAIACWYFTWMCKCICECCLLLFHAMYHEISRFSFCLYATRVFTLMLVSKGQISIWNICPILKLAL